MAPTPMRLGDVTLPQELVTETIAILGKRGAGKTTTARVLAEELLTSNLPIVVLDPTGVWWGLRSSADGQSEGFPAVIFGGDHADVPLEANAGPLIADVVIDERIPAVLDLSLLSKTSMRSFAAAFLERLYHRNRQALHVIVDEADLFAPQRLPKGAERLFGAMDDLVRRGRVRGLGVSLITQRPQVLNKDVLSQCEVLIAMRMVGTRDVAAIDDWVRLHADDQEAATVKASLPSLPIGTAWIWSPGFLGLLVRVKVQRPATYDSSATPKPGEQRKPVRRMANVDLAALGDRIAETAERAKAEDPKLLRARIATLERELAAARKDKPEPERVEVEVQVERLPPATVKKISAAIEDLAKIRDNVAAEIAASMGRISSAMSEAAELEHKRVTTAAPKKQPDVLDTMRQLQASVRASEVAREAARNGSLSKAQRAVLSALAQHGTRTTTQVALLTAYSHKSGGFRNTLSQLRTAGYIVGRGEVAITGDGLEALGDYDPLPTGAALREWWKLNHLGLAERRILDVLAEAWPQSVPVDRIAELTEYSPTSGGFRNALSRLRSFELASGRGELQITADLMED